MPEPKLIEGIPETFIKEWLKKRRNIEYTTWEKLPTQQQNLVGIVWTNMLEPQRQDWLRAPEEGPLPPAAWEFPYLEEPQYPTYTPVPPKLPMSQEDAYSQLMQHIQRTSLFVRFLLHHAVLCRNHMHFFLNEDLLHGLLHHHRLILSFL